MLVRRGFNQPQPGTWATFGGKYEKGEDLNPKDNDFPKQGKGS